MVYYIKGLHLREFGFPRITEAVTNSKEKFYKWKKANFVTDLPKHNPYIRYLVGNTKN